MMIKVSLIALLVMASFYAIRRYWLAKTLYEKTFKSSTKVLANPLQGYAPSAKSATVSDDIRLVYIDVTWADLEPEEGKYDWEGIEKTNQFQRWKDLGYHAVFRFVSDYPGDAKAIDIPDWLYQDTKDGTHYDNELGKGYSPNYSNKRLLAAFQETVAAMGERWGRDSFIAYIELGVIGHWGEWHTNLDKKQAGSIPKEHIRDQYVEPWQPAFPNAQLLMRRPFRIAAEEGYGLFNDVIGDESETKRWLDWIKEGGNYDQTGETDALVAMTHFWETAPSGGELTSAKSMQTLLGQDFESLKQQVKASHTTFLGPKIADETVSETAYQSLRRELGYRFYISRVRLLSNRVLEVTWVNDGNAPIYWKWPVKLYFSDQLTKTVNFDLRNLLPGQTQQMRVTLSKKQFTDWQSISLAINNPETDEPAVFFANDDQEDSKRLVLIKNRQLLSE